MGQITKNTERIGRFTSSEIYRLLGSKTVQNTYINEKKLEIKLGRSLQLEKTSRSMSWGDFCELRVLHILNQDSLAYSGVGDMTIAHPTEKFWAGSPDLKNEREKKGAEIKCYEPKHFAECVDAFSSNDLLVIKKECAKEYWQGVSNAILLGVDTFEWIFYMPYESELKELADDAENFNDGFKQWKYRFISEAVEKDIHELAYLPNGGYYKNLNIFKRDVSKEDIEELTTAVKEASKELEIIWQFKQQFKNFTK